MTSPHQKGSNATSSWGPVDTYQLYTLFLDSKHNRRDNVEYLRKSNEKQLARLIAKLNHVPNSNQGGFHTGMESCLGASPVSSVCSLCPEADRNSNNCTKHQNKQQAHQHAHDNSCTDTNVEDGITTPRIQQSCSNSSILHESGDYQWCLDYGYNRDNNQLSSKVPQSIFSASFNHGDFSYDDLSKNIDANLAEIDMETFRSEDIHSILTLPAMLCGDFQSTGHGEECASVSGSLLGGLDLSSPGTREDSNAAARKKTDDSNASANELTNPNLPLCKSTCSSSPRSTSEDDSADMSICKDEPLFSPVKEPPLPLGNISVDSLDCSSLEEHDLVLTCQANKNNYTIAFEGSGTQFSDDSDYQEAVGSSEGEPTCWQDGTQRPPGIGRGRGNSMIQSDFVFTTWSKLKRTKDTGRPKVKSGSSTTGGKSQSLPNLLRQSFLLSERRLTRWPTGASNAGCIPLYDIQTSRSGHSHDSDSICTPRSLSLVKLFIQNRASVSPDGGSLSISSSQSESSSCVQTPPLNRPNCNLHNSGSYSYKAKLYGMDNVSQQSGELDFHKEDIVQRQKNLDLVNEKGTNVSFPYSPVHLNFVVPTLNTASQTREANNNVDPIEAIDNNNVTQLDNATATKETHSDSEEENSQYFEDSLVDAHAIRPKANHASPIKEEEEPLDSDSSSGDETMKDSKDPFSSDSNTSEEATVTKNNSLDSPHRPGKQEFRVASVERITNVFPTGKCNTLHANTSAALGNQNKLPVKSLDFGPPNQSQGTQTKRFNSKDSSPMESVYQANPGSAATSNAPTLDSGTDVLNNVRRGCSRESSPTSSGYGSSRQNSVERLRRNPQAFIHNAHSPPSSVVLKRKTNVTITTTRNTGTQIPVHIKDQGIQTSFEEEAGSSWNFTVTERLSPRSVDDLHLNTSTKSKESTHSSRSQEKSGTTEKRSLYVCYPNYSLPDLSFLHNMAESPDAPDVVYLTPTKLKIPKSSAHHRSRASGGHNRPKSCTDFEALSRKNFNHIKDWDSLSILLPQEFKSLISRLRQVGSPTVEQADSRSPGSSIDADHALFMKFSLRGHKMGKNVENNARRGHVGPYAGSNLSDGDGGCSRDGTKDSSKRSDSNHDDYSKDSPSPPPPPKRSLSLPPQSNDTSGRQAPRSILRKSFDSDQYDEPSCQRSGQKCFSVSSAVPPKTEDPRNKRYSLQEPLLQLLEDIPELLRLQNHPDHSAGGEKKFCLPKKPPVSSQMPPYGHTLAKSASASGMQPRPCNSKLAWAAKPPQAVHQDPGNLMNRGSSEECCCGHCQPTVHGHTHRPCAGSQHERPVSDQDRTSSSDPTPLGQLQGQLCQLLGSDSNLSLVAAALLAAHSSNSTSGAQNPSSSTSSCGSNCQCSCSRGKKSVSFSEKVAVQTRKSPDDSPSVLPAPTACGCNSCGSKKKAVSDNADIGSEDASLVRSAEGDSESEGPPQEFVVSPPFGVSPVSTPHDDPSHSLLSNPVFTVLAQKRALLERLKEAVHILSSHFKVAKDSDEQEKLGNSCLTPSIGTKVLLHFCPALHTILADGLYPTVTGIFGPHPNSPWKVAEASVQQGDCKKELRELVSHITSAETLGDNHTRFTALLLGLLNLGCLHHWIAHLSNCVTVVKQHYQPNALLSMLVLSSSSVIAEELIVTLQPLSYLPFSLELSLASRRLGPQSQGDSSNTSSFCRRDTDMNENTRTSEVSNYLRPERKARSCERQRPQSMFDQPPEIDTTRRKSWGGAPLFDEELYAKYEQEWKEGARVGHSKPEHPIVSGVKLADERGGGTFRNRYESAMDVHPKSVRLDGGQHRAAHNPGIIDIGDFREFSRTCQQHDQHGDGLGVNRDLCFQRRGRMISLAAGDREMEGVANGSFTCASSSDSGCSCQTEPLQTSQTQEGSGSEVKPVSAHIAMAAAESEENHGFEELRQRWEELTSCPNSPRRGPVPESKSTALAKPPLPGRSRTRDAGKTPGGRAASSSLSRIRHPLYSKADVGALRRPLTPPSPLRSKTHSPSKRVPHGDQSNENSQTSHSPVRSGNAAATPTPGLMQPTRKSLIPVHRQGGRPPSGIPTPTTNIKKTMGKQPPVSCGQDAAYARRGFSKN